MINSTIIFELSARLCILIDIIEDDRVEWRAPYKSALINVIVPIVKLANASMNNVSWIKLVSSQRNNETSVP